MSTAVSELTEYEINAYLGASSNNPPEEHWENVQPDYSGQEYQKPSRTRRQKTKQGRHRQDYDD